MLIIEANEATRLCGSGQSHDSAARAILWPSHVNQYMREPFH